MKDNTYYQKNQERLRLYANEYKAKNLVEISAKRKERIECPKCQKSLTRDSMFHHRRRYHSDTYSDTDTNTDAKLLIIN
jgi:hypothetical protein